jgi:hypothetical protein
VSGGPEEDGTNGVEGESHEDGGAVAPPGSDEGGGDTEDEVRSEVSHLNHGGLELADTERVLNLLVENIDEGVRETPEEAEKKTKGGQRCSLRRRETRETHKREVTRAKA